MTDAGRNFLRCGINDLSYRLGCAALLSGHSHAAPRTPLVAPCFARTSVVRAISVRCGPDPSASVTASSDRRSATREGWLGRRGEPERLAPQEKMNSFHNFGTFR